MTLPAAAIIFCPATMQASDHIYVHVPFCNGKCAYCAFYSEQLTPAQTDRYLAAIERELDQLPRGSAPKTVYFGGGTPSILATSHLERLCRALLARISTERMTEWTVEANPGTLPEDKIAMLRRMGVNRISLGAQSFDDAVLDRIERRHDAAAIGDTLEMVRANGVDNVGLDLIACLPGVDDDGWRSTLKAAVRLAPDHISVYALSVEPGSAFSRTAVAEPTDGSALAALAIAEQMLTSNGYLRYEISNYCRPGRECRHNLSCWRGEDYTGFGPAAASRSGLRRWTNRSDTTAYCRAVTAGNTPPREEEELTPRSDAVERLMFAFRLGEGVPTDRLQHADAELSEHWQTALDRLHANGLAEQRQDRWFLTHRGRAFADQIASELVP